MPELPEVEGVRRSLEPHLLGVRIATVNLRRRDFCTACGARLEALVGQSFTQTLRHGKKMFCAVGEGLTLLTHLGMTGSVTAVDAAAPLEPHTHLVLTLANGRQIRWCDPRRFGGLWIYPTLRAALECEVRGRLGPDALALTPADLAPWARARGRLKQRLLSQRDVAGLGNIYVDEALWMTGLHPLKLVARVTPPQRAALVRAIRRVLERSIRWGGTTLRDYRDASDEPGRFLRKLQVYGRGGEACKRCGRKLLQATIAGRTTVFCRTCQRR